GGSTGGLTPTRQVEQLPGFDDCDDAVDVDWLSVDRPTASLNPGASLTIRVTVDSTVLAQPGTYTAGLLVLEDTPYPSPAVGVSFEVAAPKRWGRIAGLVQGVSCAGDAAPLPGATVQIDTAAGNLSLVTAADGRYSYWIDSAANPLTVIVAKDGYTIAVSKVRLRAGETVPDDADLTRADC
ncbi:MAG: carboxypeptidase regulatory-like domain-containing protein, partial [Micromonosporaceae bacterium]|nr:carboxypeptidase regulatory-like domain-containing protein [Micromonosporaceae bacterium]